MVARNTLIICGLRGIALRRESQGYTVIVLRISGLAATKRSTDCSLTKSEAESLERPITRRSFQRLEADWDGIVADHLLKVVQGGQSSSRPKEGRLRRKRNRLVTIESHLLLFQKTL